MHKYLILINLLFSLFYVKHTENEAYNSHENKRIQIQHVETKDIFNSWVMLDTKKIMTDNTNRMTKYEID